MVVVLLAHMTLVFRVEPVAVQRTCGDRLSTSTVVCWWQVVVVEGTVNIQLMVEKVDTLLVPAVQ